MKKTFLLLLLCSFAVQAQITGYNNAARNDFYGIGGYSFSQVFFQGGVRPNPDVVLGPSPQNDFTYTVSADGGIQHVYTYIATLNVNKSIRFEFKSNNVRKFGCKTTAVNIPIGQATNEVIIFTAYSNQGNSTATTGSLTDFVGFNITGNENEYITLITATFQNTSTNSIAINNITIGDNTPQNVALNFDGIDDFVSLPNSVGNFGTNDNFTVTSWVKPDASATGEQNIINKWNGSGGYAFTIRYYGSSGTILAGQYDGTNFPYVQSTTNLKDGKWHHVGFVKNGNNLLLYIDGIQEGGTGIDNANLSTTNITPLQIGREATGTKYFKGEIDEVRIWSVAKTATEIADERFCKTPNSTNLQAFYNFNNGVSHDNNTLITQVQDVVGTNHGTLTNFAKTGDASNFVTGQVKYVEATAFGTFDGSSWANAFWKLLDALPANSCNDLFEVYVAKGVYRPSSTGNVNESLNIPAGMRIYGGFAGTEKSINQRNLALIHSTNKTTLSGDLAGNDTPFNFTTNRTDNSINVVKIIGNNAIFDGFTVGGGNGNGNGGGLLIFQAATNVIVKNSRVIDNGNYGLLIFGNSANISNCSMSGNGGRGIETGATQTTINNSLIANNGNNGIFIGFSGFAQNTINNCTIVANVAYGIVSNSNSGTMNNTIKNTIINGNALGGTSIGGSGTVSNTIANSLVQGNAGGTNGNLNGNTTNPQFVSPLANTIRSDAGDYRLKWCSKAIDAGTNTGISPLDLDRNPRNFNGTADMGAYEFLGNTPSQVNNSNITGTIDMPMYAGGAIQTITSDAKILAPAGAIDFKAPNSITLNPGFEARGMSNYFKAQIGANVTCNN